MIGAQGSKKRQLTEEQLRLIEKNRRIALEKLQERRINSDKKIEPTLTKILPTRENLSASRSVPYTKPNAPYSTNYSSSFSSKNLQKPPALVPSTSPNLQPPTKKIPNSLNNYVPSTIPKSPQPKVTLAHPIADAAIKPKTNLVCEFTVLDEDRFTVRCAYDKEVIDQLKTVSTAHYNVDNKSWSYEYSAYDQVVNALKKFPYVRLVLLKEFFVKQMTKERNEITEECLSNIEPELISTLLDFQRQGVCFGISRGGRCLIADDMGLGKSRQALAIAEYYRDDWPLLIVTNASTREFWAKEISDLLPKVRTVDIAIVNNQWSYMGHERIIICSYTNLQQDYAYLMQKNFGAIIFDESHNLKNNKAKQTEHAKKIAAKARRVIMVTGTPALSKPVELFTQLEMIDNGFASFHQFTERYCGGRKTNFGWLADGATHLKELNLLLTKSVMIRRIKSEVFIDLSLKNRKLVTLEDYEYEMNEQMYETDCEMEELFSQFHHVDTLTRETEGALLIWYQKTAEKKAYGVCRFINDYLTKNDAKVLIFAHHAYMMSVICGELEKFNVKHIKIDGAVCGNARSERVQNFQTDSSIRAAVLSIRACNAGITLTRASTVIFAELDWNPSTLIQAEARAHRIGQENEVNVFYLIASRTADEFIWRLLSRKQERLGQAGLVANVENLMKNVQKMTFNVKRLTYDSNEKNNNLSNAAKPSKYQNFTQKELEEIEELERLYCGDF